MVNPDVGRRLDVNQILALRWVVQNKVSDNNILDVLETEATVLETGVAARSNDGGVAADLEDIATGQHARDCDHTTSLKSRLELSTRGNGGRSARSSTGRAGAEADRLTGGDSASAAGRGSGGSLDRDLNRGGGCGNSSALLASEGNRGEKRQKSVVVHLDKW